MKKDCAFQYYNGRNVVEDMSGITLEEAKEFWNEWYDDIVKESKNDSDVEVAIWINMKDKDTYRDTLIHLRRPNVDEHGRLWEKQYFNKF